MSSVFKFLAPLTSIGERVLGDRWNYLVNFLQRYLPYSVVVYKEGTTIYAYKANGDLVTSGTDASTVIQAAISALSGGGKCLIRAASYTIATALVITPSNIHVRGEGKATVFVGTENVDMFTVNASDTEISHLYFDHVATGTGRGIHVSTAKDRLYFHDLVMDDCYHGIRTVNNCNDVTIENNTFNAGGRDSAQIFCINSSGNVARRLRIINNRCISAAVHGIEVYASAGSGLNWEDVKTDDNFVHDPNNAGIFWAQVKGGTCNGNIVYSNGAEGLDFEYCTNFTVNDNVVRESNLQSINVLPVGAASNDDIEISGNNVQQASSSGSDAINLDTVNRVTCNDNTIYAYNDGINVIHNSTDIVINGNKIRRGGTAGQNGVRLDVGAGQTLDNVIVSDNRVANFSSGVSSNSGTQTDVMIIDNDLTDNTAGYTPTVTPTNLIVRNNQGYKTENSGTATVANGTTSIAVTHGLAYTPTAAEITINYTENPTNPVGMTFITSITSTQFTVNVENDPGASNLDFSWAVRRI